MPSTQPYIPTKSFGDDPAAVDQIDASGVDTQLRLISANLASLIAALGVSIRDDNTLTDQLVRIRNLHPELATYIESAISGTIATQALSFKYPVDAVAATNIVNLFGLQTIDGVALPEGARLLMVGQTDPTQNGIWIVHDFGGPVPSGLWERASDLPGGTASGQGWAVASRQGGTTLGGTVWAIIAGGDPTDEPVVGTDELEFFQVFGPFPIPVARGGTGAITAAGARANLGAAGVYKVDITGNGSQTIFQVNHNLNSLYCNGWAVNDSTGEAIGVTVVNIGADTAQVAFSIAPAAGIVHRITILG
jgi:hypothetical protein